MSEARRSIQMRPGAESRTLATLLINNLQDPDSRVRELSAAMLAGFPTEAERSLPALDESLSDADAGVRTAARRSMKQLIKTHLAKPAAPKAGASSAPSLNPDAVAAPRP